MNDLPPQALDVERTVLGSMLINEKALAAVFEQHLLDESTFYSGANIKIFLCMKEMFDQRIPVDIITLADVLRKKQWLESVGEEPYIAEIAESIATPANIAFYVRQLREKAILRQIIEANTEATCDAFKADASPIAIIDKLSAAIGQLEISREGYDLTKWPLSRFSGEPEPDKFLVRDLMPQGVAGTLYSAGGSGKSTLALDLSLRVAIAGTFPTLWLGKYHVDEEKRVLYVSAEEPENQLHKRVQGLTDAIAVEIGISAETLLNTAKPNLLIVNVWGEARQLFDVKSSTITPTGEYNRILGTLKKDKIGFLIIDTRSRLSGAEGAGNAIVGREVALYEQWAAQSGATVLILHHTNKASYGGFVHAQAAQRGESAFSDCLRFGVYLQPMSEETAASNGIPDNERLDYLTVVHSKSNYTRIQEPLILHRNGWSFELTTLKPKPIREEIKSRQDDEDLTKIIQAVREYPGINQRGLIDHFKNQLSMGRVRDGLKNGLACGCITPAAGERGAILYTVNEMVEPP